MGSGGVLVGWFCLVLVGHGGCLVGSGRLVLVGSGGVLVVWFCLVLVGSGGCLVGSGGLVLVGSGGFLVGWFCLHGSGGLWRASGGFWWVMAVLKEICEMLGTRTTIP